VRSLIKRIGVIAVTAAFLPLLRLSDAPRIVNVSSSAGSLTKTSDFANPDLIALGYVPSKTALTSLTIQYASGLAAENILVNAICPRFVARDLNGFRGVRSTSEGAVQADGWRPSPPTGRPAPSPMTRARWPGSAHAPGRWPTSSTPACSAAIPYQSRWSIFVEDGPTLVVP
jgi:NAD(P)-dependent dehydrogenase (short-subunit alcohol dehydrogenase family)